MAVGMEGQGISPSISAVLDQDLQICIYTVITWASSCWSSSHTATVNGLMKGQVLDTDSSAFQKRLLDRKLLQYGQQDGQDGASATANSTSPYAGAS